MSPGELKVIWAKMLDKPNWFNRDLTWRIHINLLDDKRHHYILDVDIFDPALFTLENQLNADGKIRMWSEINEQIKLFDQYKVSLKPDDRNDRRLGREAGDFNRTNHRSLHRHFPAVRYHHDQSAQLSHQPSHVVPFRGNNNHQKRNF